MANTAYKPPFGGRRGLCLLSLDGGGIRCLSSLIILREIMRSINQDDPPRPCDVFDMIGGSGEGGLIAIMLGRLGMTVDECIDTFTRISESIYSPVRRRLTLTGKLQGRFDTAAFQQAVQEIVAERLQDKDELFRTQDIHCKVFVTASLVETMSPVLLRSYQNARSRDAMSRDATIWQAARATSAATTFFEPIEIAGANYMIAIGSTNPVREVWLEAAEVWPQTSLADGIRCFISLGTGLQPVRAFSGTSLAGFGASVMAITTETERTAEFFLREHPELEAGHRYHRFNVSQGLQDVGLDEYRSKAQVVAATRSYIGAAQIQAEMKDSSKQLAEEHDYRSYMEILLLESPPQEIFEEKVKQLAFQGAGSWIFRNSVFHEWASTKSTQSLWIRGLPGCGKTTMASTIIQELSKDLVSGREDTVLGFFFCSFQDPSTTNAASILTSLIYQILLQRPDLFSNFQYTQELAVRYSNPLMLLDVFSADFADIMKSPGPKVTYLVVDALDECNPESLDRFFELMKPYLDSSRKYSDTGKFSTLKWLFTSRYESGISYHLEAVPAIEVESDRSWVDQEVEDAIEKEFKVLAKRIDFPPAVQEFVRDFLRDTARKGYMWVDIVSQNLQKNYTTKAAVEAVLSGSLPLSWAASAGLDDVVRRLVYRGIDIESRDSSGKTALILATEFNHPTAVSTLLELGADINAQGQDGLLALQIAVQKGHKDIVSLLLRSGADVKVKTFTDESLAHLANGNEEILLLLRDRPLVEGPGRLGPRPTAHVDLVSRPRLPDSEHAQNACERFTANVIDFFDLQDEPLREKRIEEKMSVYDVIYGQGAEKIMASSVSTSKKDRVFRWYHLPANNLAWVEALIGRILNDRKTQAADFDDQAKEKLGLARTSGYQHRGITHHSCFMGPLCQDIKVGSEDGLMLFMPYLDSDSSDSQDKLAASIKRLTDPETNEHIPPPSNLQGASTTPEFKDEELIKGYLRTYPGWPIPPLHIRRTLDQFFYTELEDTHSRDTDQVVYRYTKLYTPRSIKIFMVDQLWLWVLDKGTIITSLPQRWGQLSSDSSPPDIHKAISQQLNSRNRAEIRSVEDLVVLITNCCTRTFDRYRIPRIPDEYQFFDMFESSIGSVSNKETKLFKDFKDNAAKVATGGPEMKSEDSQKALNALFNIQEEIEVLTEIKDIRDELNILKMVLEDQKQVVERLGPVLAKTFGYVPSNHTIALLQVMNRSHQSHIEEMNKRAESIYDALNHLLDLKQKQTNAAEARFARQSAEDTSRQGQTILVFTVVTIIFSLLSFMTAIFALNIVEFPRDIKGNLSLHYVSKYIFGVSLGVAFPLVLIAIYISNINDWLSGLKTRTRSQNAAPPVTEEERKPLAPPKVVSLEWDERHRRQKISVKASPATAIRKRKPLGDEESNSVE